MLLGDLIDGLQKLPPGLRFRDGLHNPHSYRGSYDELAFEPLRLPRETRRSWLGLRGGGFTVLSILELAQACVGAEFRGYKGGDFTMSLHTPVSVAFFGAVGIALAPEYFVIDFELGDELPSSAAPGPHNPHCPSLAGTYGL